MANVLCSRGWQRYVIPLTLTLTVFATAYFATHWFRQQASSQHPVDSREAKESNPPDSGPRLAGWKKTSVQLGNGKIGEVKHGSFMVRNVGTEPLTFNIRTNCACAECEPRQGQVPPGGVQEVKLGVKLRREGKLEHVLVRIRTNDPENDETELSFFAKCPGPLVVDPMAAHFEVMEGRISEAVVQVRDAQGKRLSPSTELVMHSDIPFLEMERVEIEEQGLGVAIRVKNTAPRGLIQGEVVLARPGVEGSIRVDVSGEVMGPFKVRPRVVRMKTIPEGVEGRFGLQRSKEEALGKLVRAEAPPGLIVEEMPLPDSEWRRFRVRATPDCKLTGRQTLRLHFEGVVEGAEVSVVLPGESG